ncbi:uncharacterized protein PV07_04860 [Cladophialophora immunda]|uniref:Uncharacterized protein n=1 Tax=Cladophialophora immunda TaxID=569365 RepID=A0A0D2CD57_9EURO|nr:uncharacterized protein PV07_04860 [Cladophialophora immunda]KIW29013.1 hypothetical protein PV07_04860 [Cladophialophora immunda]
MTQCIPTALPYDTLHSPTVVIDAMNHRPAFCKRKNIKSSSDRAKDQMGAAKSIIAEAVNWPIGTNLDY